MEWKLHPMGYIVEHLHIQGIPLSLDVAKCDRRGSSRYNSLFTSNIFLNNKVLRFRVVLYTDTEIVTKRDEKDVQQTT